MSIRIAAKFSLAAIVLSAAASAQITDAQRLMTNPKFQAAMDFVSKDHDRFVREIIQLTEIEAPPFQETLRAKAYAEMLRQNGLTNVEIDAEGNAMGIRRGSGTGPLLAVAAHLDTVFPQGTNVKVRREGTRLYAPGIGDDSRALAVILLMIRAMEAAKIQTEGDILFIGNVGEEGPGDLRGMKYLFQKGPYKDRIKMFISLDPAGNGNDITTGGVGSKRYKVTFKGPGGHSYGSFGTVNPAFALANAVAKLSRLQVPSRPRTTYNVGVIGGGTAVNAIPAESWMDVDIRSEAKDELNRAADSFLRFINEAVEEENKARSISQGRVQADVKLIGDRPFGEIPVTAPIVQTASALVRAFGLTPSYTVSSTDANIPLSMGIPAVTLESGGSGGRNHSLDEWIDVEKTASVRGINIALGVVLALAGFR